MHRTALGGLMLAIIVAAGQPVMAQDTLVGLGPVRGYTDVVFDTTAERYDILVDASRPEDAAAHRYQTLQAAYAAAPEGTRDRPTVIGLMPFSMKTSGTSSQPSTGWSESSRSRCTTSGGGSSAIVRRPQLRDAGARGC